MTKKTNNPTAPQPDAPAPADEYAGQGGSYVIDPATGKRTLVARTQAADNTAPAATEE